MRFVGKEALPAVSYALLASHRFVSPINEAQVSTVELIRRVGRERTLLLRLEEALALIAAVRATDKTNGHLAEVGVFQGASAKLICEAKGDRILHLFDTFEGLPSPGPADSSGFYQGRFECALEDVQMYLEKYQNVAFHKGHFPKTGVAVEELSFSFVNLDVDLYDCTRDALEFFYPRMERGGIILSHDYATEKGVRKAVSEFFDKKPEPVMSLLGSQCMIVKTGPGQIIPNDGLESNQSVLCDVDQER
jgi:hypothetical protein